MALVCNVYAVLHVSLLLDILCFSSSSYKNATILMSQLTFPSKERGVLIIKNILKCRAIHCVEWVDGFSVKIICKKSS